jgi:hypothetical protein
MSDQRILGDGELVALENTLALRPIGGCCCSIGALYTAWPQCIGCEGDTEILCIKGNFQALKPVQDPESHDWCNVVNCRFIGKNVETCCKQQQQCFCCVGRAALPCDDDVPCILNIYGLTLNFKNKCMFACCETVEQLTQRGENGELRLKGQDQVDQKKAEKLAAESGVQK